VRGLGVDPAQGGKFNPNEAATAVRIEKQLGITLDRMQTVTWTGKIEAPHRRPHTTPSVHSRGNTSTGRGRTSRSRSSSILGTRTWFP